MIILLKAEFIIGALSGMIGHQIIRMLLQRYIKRSLSLGPDLLSHKKDIWKSSFLDRGLDKTSLFYNNIMLSAKHFDANEWPDFVVRICYNRDDVVFLETMQAFLSCNANLRSNLNAKLPNEQYRDLYILWSYQISYQYDRYLMFCETDQPSYVELIHTDNLRNCSTLKLYKPNQNIGTDMRSIYDAINAIILFTVMGLDAPNELKIKDASILFGYSNQAQLKSALPTWPSHIVSAMRGQTLSSEVTAQRHVRQVISQSCREYNQYIQRLITNDIVDVSAMPKLEKIIVLYQSTSGDQSDNYNQENSMSGQNNVMQRNTSMNYYMQQNQNSRSRNRRCDD